MLLNAMLMEIFVYVFHVVVEKSLFSNRYVQPISKALIARVSLRIEHRWNLPLLVN